ncbi:MAG: hypothetical protein R3D44_12875 [Hyphomicrobiaceae bacterium]
MANVLSAGGSMPVSKALGPWAVRLACLLAVVAVAALRFKSHGAELHTSLGDTDDATRLLELHSFLQHGGWWDLTIERIGAPEVLVSHWSRLVDLGLAVVLGAASLMMSPAKAELAMRIVWPSLVLFGLALVVARDAERDGGTIAACIVAGLITMSSTALYQFNIGRIDHHNVQILCAVGGTLLLARSMIVPEAGWGAGLLIGAGLTVGLESATMVGPAIVVAVLLGLGRRGGLEGQMRAAAMMAGTLGVGCLLSIDPRQLGTMFCDSVSLNLVALAAFGAAGVAAAAFVARHRDGRGMVPVQLGLLAVGGGIGLVAYGMLEPRCLAGPFGQVSAEVWPIWLSRVTEGQPIGYLYGLSAGGTLGFVLLVLLGIAARIRIALADRDANGERDDLYRHLMLVSAQTLAFVAACWQVKMMPYAAWLALPALAVVISRLPSTGTIGAPIVRLGAFVLVWQSTLGALAGGALALVHKPAKVEPPTRTSCSDTPTISALAQLPPGLVLADINLGPYIAALTPHRVVMAPYHRLDKSIVEGTRLLTDRPEAAEAGLRKLGVTYVMACKTKDWSETYGETAKAPAEGSAPKLKDALAGGKAPAYLAPVDVPGASGLHVYRVLPPKS